MHGTIGFPILAVIIGFQARITKFVKLDLFLLIKARTCVQIAIDSAVRELMDSKVTVISHSGTSVLNSSHGKRQQ
jgi:hypothetical protein